MVHIMNDNIIENADDTGNDFTNPVMPGRLDKIEKIRNWRSLSRAERAEFIKNEQDTLNDKRLLDKEKLRQKKLLKFRENELNIAKDNPDYIPKNFPSWTKDGRLERKESNRSNNRDKNKPN